MTKRQNIALNASKSVHSVPVIDILGYRISHNSIKPDPERLQSLQEYPPPSNVSSLRRALGMFAYYARWIPQFADKIRPLADTVSFPLDQKALASFNTLKDKLARAALSPINEDIPFVVECDASDVAISASLNQNGRHVAFLSKTLSGSQRHHPCCRERGSVYHRSCKEVESFTITSAIYSYNRLAICLFHVFDNRRHSKIKNGKIQSW